MQKEIGDPFRESLSLFCWGYLCLFQAGLLCGGCPGVCFSSGGRLCRGGFCWGGRRLLLLHPLPHAVGAVGDVGIGAGAQQAADRRSGIKMNAKRDRLSRKESPISFLLGLFVLIPSWLTLRQLSRRLLQQWGQTLPWRFRLGRSPPVPSPPTPAHGRGGW